MYYVDTAKNDLWPGHYIKFDKEINVRENQKRQSWLDIPETRTAFAQAIERTHTNKTTTQVTKKDGPHGPLKTGVYQGALEWLTSKFCKNRK